MKRTTIIAILVIILSIGLGAYHGYYKEYFYEDEVLSYTLSNSLNGAYFNLRPGEWYEGSSLYEYLYVLPGHEFDWENTAKNQMLDSHPPIYALALHGVCSFIPGRFSKWCGIGLNLAAFAVVLTVFYVLIRELALDRPCLAILICGIFGMNAGVVSLVIFIRMYILLMLFAMLTVYWHVRSIGRSLSPVSYIVLSVITYMGIMTHYYFAVLAFYLGLFFCIHLVLEKKYKEILYYIASMLASGLIIIVTWYKALSRILSDEVFEDADAMGWSMGVLVQKLRDMFTQTNVSLFGGMAKPMLVVIAVYGLYLLVKDREKLYRAFHADIKLQMISVVSILFYITISVLTPYVTVRYVSPSFPFLILIAILTLDQVVSEVFRSHVLGLVLLAGLFLYPEAQTLRGGLVDINRQIISEASSAHEDDICLFCESIPPEENVFELKKFDKIYVYDKENINDIPDIPEADELVIYIPEDEDPEEYAAAIQAQNPKLTEMERLYVAYYSTCYVMHQ